MGKTRILAKGPQVRHVYKWDHNFLQNDPDLQDITNDCTPDMFSVQEIEVLGTPLGTDIYKKDFVVHKCVKIARNVERLEPITDGFVIHQLVNFCMNIWTQFMRTNITIPHQEKFLSA